MPIQDEKLLARLRATFKVEASEHIQTVASTLIDLEKVSGAENRARVLDVAFRAAHSLKGAARTVRASSIEALCQAVESVFGALKRQQITTSRELFDLLHRCADTLAALLRSVDMPVSDTERMQLAQLLDAIQSALHGRLATSESDVRGQEEPSAAHVGPPGGTGPVGAPAVADTIRVATTKLDTILVQVEELLSVKAAVEQHATHLRALRKCTREWRNTCARVRQHMPVSRDLTGDQWTRFKEFLESNDRFVESLETQLSEQSKTADHDRRATAAVVDNLLDEMQQVVMQPFATVLAALPRFVRDLSRDQSKEVELVVRGAEIELDRRILEEMKDPLIHLIRNSIDHGIEPPAVRRQCGKPVVGAVTIELSTRNGSGAELLVADDGAGIDAEKVKAAAVAAHMLTQPQADALPVEDTLSLVFRSGISTSPMITDISGRGLGLAIVSEKVGKLNGSVRVESQATRGTAFRITLPLTLARFRGVVVRAGERRFVLPTRHVERVARARLEDIKTVENRATVVLDGRAVALARLDEVLEQPKVAASPEPPAVVPFVVLAQAGERIAMLVDEVLNEQEVVVKPLGRPLARVAFVAGATVLRGGEVVPILNIRELLRCAVLASRGHAITRVDAKRAQAAAPERKRLLVAEDSITTRILLKTILETAGYDVETAVDGIDAFTKARAGTFHVVISDVDMPRLNGFGLTARIRADRRLGELPVVLVTALESREDREQGIDVGANAYLVKSSFDQGNLLEVVGRLA